MIWSIKFRNELEADNIYIWIKTGATIVVYILLL